MKWNAAAVCHLGKISDNVAAVVVNFTHYVKEKRVGIELNKLYHIPKTEYKFCITEQNKI